MSCGITLLRNHRGPLTVASSDSIAAQLDEVQYGQDDGPCLQALHTGQVVDVRDLSDEHRWGTYPQEALRYGVRSCLSLPLAVGDEARGALNLYCGTPRAFSAADRDRGQQFANQAAAALNLVGRHARQLELSDQLRGALASRGVIDQALGIMMAQQRCTAPAAFAVLRAASQNRNRKLRDVAADIIRAVSGEDPYPEPFNEPY